MPKNSFFNPPPPRLPTTGGRSWCQKSDLSRHFRPFLEGNIFDQEDPPPPFGMMTGVMGVVGLTGVTLLIGVTGETRVKWASKIGEGEEGGGEEGGEEEEGGGEDITVA